MTKPIKPHKSVKSIKIFTSTEVNDPNEESDFVKITTSITTISVTKDELIIPSQLV